MLPSPGHLFPTQHSNRETARLVDLDVVTLSYIVCPNCGRNVLPRLITGPPPLSGRNWTAVPLYSVCPLCGGTVRRFYSLLRDLFHRALALVVSLAAIALVLLVGSFLLHRWILRAAPQRRQTASTHASSASAFKAQQPRASGAKSAGRKIEAPHE